MNNLYDKKLTERFKDALENYEAAYDPADWNDMQKRLGHKTPYRKWVIGGLALLAASVLMGALLLPAMEEQLPKPLSAQQQTLSPDAHKAAGNDIKNSAGTELKTDRQLPAENNHSASPAKARHTGKNRPSQLAEYSVHHTRSKRHTALPPQFPGKKAAGLSGHPDKKLLPMADVAALKTEAAEANAALQATQELALLGQLDLRLLQIKNAQPDIKAQRNDDFKPAKASWKLGLAFMPLINRFTFETKDAANAANFAPIKNSEVMEIKISQPGLSAGLAFEKSLGRNWMLGSGAQLSYVHLQLSNRRAYLESSPIKVDAGQNLPSRETYLNEEKWLRLNVPLQLRYNLSSDAKRELFVSGGLANFFYLHETYTYQEQVPLKSNAFLPDFAMTTKKVSKTPLTRSSISLAAAVYLSAGMERKTGRCTSLQLEPFVMLPLKHSRHEALQMATTGITMRFNYQRL